MKGRKGIIIALVFLAALILIAGGYFVYFYQSQSKKPVELLKPREQSQITRSECLGGDEFADYPINPKYAEELKVPPNPLIISVRDKVTQEGKFSFQIEGI